MLIMQSLFSNQVMVNYQTLIDAVSTLMKAVKARINYWMWAFPQNTKLMWQSSAAEEAQKVPRLRVREKVHG